jgi:MFS family permease
MHRIPKQIKFLFLLIFITNFACQTITAFGFPLYFKSLGADAFTIGILLGIMWLGPFVSELFLGKFADRINPTKLYLLSFLVIIPINIILIFVASPFVAAGLLFIQGAAFGLEGLVITRLMFESVGKSSGRDIAFASNAGYLAVIFGSLAGGLIMDYLGFQWIFISRISLFSICALLMVVASKKIFPQPSKK